jgi:ADP-ribose pyrophosphatase YjhB (NUDIX family)
MEIRCCVAVFRDDAVLLVRSREDGATVWKVPGGHVRADEGLSACGRRELREETGLEAGPLRCGLFQEVHDEVSGRYIAEVVLFPLEKVHGQPRPRERGRQPYFVPLSSLRHMVLRPPIGHHLQGLHDLHRRELADQDDETGPDDAAMPSIATYPRMNPPQLPRGRTKRTGQGRREAVLQPWLCSASGSRSAIAVHARPKHQPPITSLGQCARSSTLLPPTATAPTAMTAPT